MKPADPTTGEKVGAALTGVMFVGVVMATVTDPHFDPHAAGLAFVCAVVIVALVAGVDL